MSDDKPTFEEALRNVIGYLAAREVEAAVQREREACAAVADRWVVSPTCVPGEVCEHIRQASAIKDAILARGKP